MDGEFEAATADREALLAHIARLEERLAAQQAEIERLQARLAELEGRAGKGDAKGMPGLKPGAAAPPREKKARKRRERAFFRRRMAPTGRVEHAIERCPDCDIALFGGSVKRTREVIELALMPVRVVEHAFIERVCPTCARRLVPGEAVLDGVTLGRQRLGVGLVAMVATLREVGRLPFDIIQWYLETFHGLHLGAGELAEVVHRVAGAGAGAVAAIRERVRASPVVNADETGWREDGANGYLWTFSTPSERYFVRGGRNKEMVDEALGETFSGVLVCDFYAAYDHHAGLIQRCWAHLLRDVHELAQQHPADKALRAWAKAVHRVYEDAKAFRHDDPRARRRAQGRFERRLLRVCAPYADDADAPQRALCARVRKHLPELFVFVALPEVPSDNNAAERSLRHLVTARKISGGTRSPQGSDSKMALATLFGTWAARGLNPFLECRNLLVSPTT
jgi:transposase